MELKDAKEPQKRRIMPPHRMVKIFSGKGVMGQDLERIVYLQHRRSRNECAQTEGKRFKV